MKSFSPVERFEDRSINPSCSDSFVSPFISLSEIEGQREEINKGISRANKLSHAYLESVLMLPLRSEWLLLDYSGPTWWYISLRKLRISGFKDRTDSPLLPREGNA